MRYDHIVDLNDKMAGMREQADETLAILRRQHEQLESLVASATGSLQVITNQIEQLEALHRAIGQMAGTDSPLRMVEIEASLASALGETHRVERDSENAA